MASTPSTNLRLRLQGVGDNSNTWGTELNNALSMIDGTLTGTHAVSTTGGDTTISVSDYTLGDFHNMRVNVTGTLGSNANIIVPTNERIWIVTNNTSGAFSVTIKTSGGTGVACPQGDTIITYCDGTNVIGMISTGASVSGNLNMAGFDITNIGGVGFNVTDAGTVSSGTVTFDASATTAHKLTVGGTLTLAFTGFPTGDYGAVAILLVNGGSATLTWPTINWIKSDRTTSNNFNDQNVTLKSSGENQVYVWSFDGGTTLYGVAF